MSRYDGRASLSDRLGALTGAAWVILIMVGNGLTESGAPTGDSPAAAKAYFALQHQTSHQVGMALELLGFCLMAAFVAWLCAALRAAERPGAWLSVLALAGGVTTLAVKLGSAAPYYVGYLVTDLPGDQAQLMQRINEAAFLVSAATSGLLVVGVAGSALTSGLLPRWLAGGGLLIGGLAIVGSLDLTSLDGGPGVAGFLLGLLWLAGVSLFLALRSRGPLRGGSQEAAPAPA